MKTTLKKLSALLAAAALIFLIFHESVPVRAQTVDSISPHVVANASEEELAGAAVTTLAFNGKVFVRVDIPVDGCLYMDLYARSADFIYMEFYTDMNGASIISQTCPCTANRANRGTLMQYLAKGSYYLRISGNQNVFNTLEIRSLLYAKRNETIKSGDSVVSYCDYQNSNYYTYTPTANGYITLTEKTVVGNDVPPLIGLCDSNGEVLTERMHTYKNQDKIVYAVKKNTTYKIWVSASDSTQQHFYQLKLKFKKQADKSGAKKAKAKKVEFGNKVKGTVFAEDELEKADWYKFTNEKKQKVSLECVGSITSGSMIFNIYNSADEKIGECQVVAGVDQSQSYITTSGNDAELLEAGTYYLKITKSRKTATGIYSFVLHPLG